MLRTDTSFEMSSVCDDVRASFSGHTSLNEEEKMKKGPTQKTEEERKYDSSNMSVISRTGVLYLASFDECVMIPKKGDGERTSRKNVRRKMFSRLNSR